MTGSEIGRLAWAREKHRRRQALGQRHHQPMRRHDNTAAWGSARVYRIAACAAVRTVKTVAERFLGARAGRGSGEIYFSRAPPQHGRIRAPAVSFYGSVPVVLWCDVKCASCSCHIPSQQAQCTAKERDGGCLTGPVWCSRVWCGVVWCSRVWCGGVVLGAGGRQDSARMKPKALLQGDGGRRTTPLQGVESAKAGRVRGRFGGSAGCIRKRLPSSSPAKHARVGPLGLFLMWGPPGFRGLVRCRMQNLSSPPWPDFARRRPSPHSRSVHSSASHGLDQPCPRRRRVGQP
jgi:hypothetical protein